MRDVHHHRACRVDVTIFLQQLGPTITCMANELIPAPLPCTLSLSRLLQKYVSAMPLAPCGLVDAEADRPSKKNFCHKAFEAEAAEFLQRLAPRYLDLDFHLISKRSRRPA